jgi:hypothetical protein
MSLATATLLVAGTSEGLVTTAAAAAAWTAAAIGLLALAAALRGGRWLFPVVMALVVLAAGSLLAVR